MKNILRILTFSSLGLLLLLFAGLISQLQPQKMPKVTVGRVEFKVEIADEPSEWRKGLAGHPPLETGEGLLFIFPTPMQKTFWMKDVTYPIDIVWIHENKVVGFVDNAPPDDGKTLYHSPGPVEQVLEIAAGERQKLGISVGAPVTVE